MTIPVADLKTVVTRLLDDLIARGIVEVELDRSFYWTVRSDVRYDMRVDRSEMRFGIGSLVDDWGFVKGLCDPDNDPVTYQLTEVAPLLRYIGEKVSGCLPT